MATEPATGWVVDSGQPDAGLALDITRNVNVSVPYKTYKVAMYKQPSLPSSSVDACYGKINSGSYNGAAANTVLYQGYQASRQTSFGGGTALWTITHHFLISPYDLRSEFINGQWQVIVKGSTYKYLSTSFLALPT